MWIVRWSCRMDFKQVRGQMLKMGGLAQLALKKISSIE